MRQRVSRFVFACSLVLIAVSAVDGTSPPGPLVRGEELVISGADFSAGVGQGARVTAHGLMLDPASGTNGTYTSSPIVAPLPFTDVGALWDVTPPAAGNQLLELRTSKDGEFWGEWIQAEPDLDPAPSGSQGMAGTLVSVPQSDRVHRYVQYRWSFSAAADGRAPLLRSLRLAFIDGGITPRTAAPLHANGYPKPSVVSRTDWGCPDGQDSPSWPPEYEPVTHAVVHHTVSSNDDTDFAARVRAIWYFHTVTRGWGDIGYNYLVARDGSLYEGRAGGDDMVGAHAYPVNAGSMGIGFIGTFISDPVPQPMVDSAADLIAWKADQKDFSPQGWGWLHDRWLPRILGHRDVSETACPGDVLYSHLPLLRDETASRLNAQANILVDELEAELSQAHWYDGPSGCGYRGHANWTFSTTNPGGSANWGTWRPNLPQAGPYRVYAFVPYCINGYPDSSGVFYQVHHAGGDTTVPVSQADGAGSWVELGQFDFNAGNEGTVFLDDMAVDDWRTIWFDTVKWTWAGGDTLPPQNASPADGTWSASRDLIFEWYSSPTQDVDHYWLLIAANPGLTDLIHESFVDPSEPGYLYHFSNDAQAYWGVKAHGLGGYSPPSGTWQLGVDTVAPFCSADRVFVYPDGHYSVHWTGEDAGSGAAAFDVEYRVGAGGDWTPWLTDTANSGAVFPHPVTDPVYFRCRARDLAGNQGGFGSGTTSTDDAILLDHAVWLPLAYR